MSYLADSRQGTPEFAYTASQSTGERSYQDPPSPYTPGGESSNARFSAEPSTLFAPSFAANVHPICQDNYDFDLFSVETQITACAPESSTSTNDVLPCSAQVNVGNAQYPIEGATTTRPGVLTNDVYSELGAGGNCFIRPEHDDPLTNRLYYFDAQSLEHNALDLGFLHANPPTRFPDGTFLDFDTTARDHDPGTTEQQQQHFHNLPEQPIAPLQPASKPLPASFDCPWCGKTCGRQTDLGRHMSTSCPQLLGTRKFACGSCKHKEMRRDKMLLHCRKKHGHARGKEVLFPIA